jgi:DNA repair protein RecO (recombination protein O)
VLHKTRGIVFRFVKYGETSIIVTIFTELFGLQSYIVNGVRSAKASTKISLFQPLTLLDLVVYHKENAAIMRIKEVRCAYHFKTLYQDVKKATVSLFLNEVINKSIKEETHANEVGRFLFESLETLDKMGGGYENFHLIFLIKLSRYLGFGLYNSTDILTGKMLDTKEELIFNALVEANYDSEIAITNTQRRALLDLIIQFYTTHTENMSEIRSIEVLREVLG